MARNDVVEVAVQGRNAEQRVERVHHIPRAVREPASLVVLAWRRDSGMTSDWKQQSKCNKHGREGEYITRHVWGMWSKTMV